MSWSTCIALPRRRRSTQADGPGHGHAGPLRLDRTQCAAGDTVRGSVACESVVLFRVERHLDHRRVFRVAEARPSATDGTFVLSVPDSALPSAAGDSCAVRYVVCAPGAAAVASADLVVLASARPHVESGSLRADRLLANWDARHFHLELCDADLRGGGRIQGRLHCHGNWPPGPIAVTACCLECWRLTTAFSRGLPTWDAATLWEQTDAVRVDPDATWTPFGFELPDGVPPAVEASTIAWRYELRAHRRVWHWFEETAALTPLLYDHE